MQIQRQARPFLVSPHATQRQGPVYPTALRCVEYKNNIIFWLASSSRGSGSWGAARTEK